MASFSKGGLSGQPFLCHPGDPRPCLRPPGGSFYPSSPRGRFHRPPVTRWFLFPLVTKRAQNRAQNALTRPNLIAQRARRIWRGLGVPARTRNIAFSGPPYPPGGGSTVLPSHLPSRGLSWPDEAIFPYCGRKQSCTTFWFFLDRPRAPNLALGASDSREQLRGERKQSCTTRAPTTLTSGEAGGSEA
jgi:hypothetical protein